MIKKKEKYFRGVLVIIFIIVHFLLITHYGIRNLYDAKRYVQEADFFLHHGRLEDIHHAFYVVVIGLIAFFRMLFPGEIIPYLIFQMAVSCLAIFALYASSTHIFNNKLAGLISCLLALFWWDNIHWNTTTMTESLSFSMICFVMYAITFFGNTRKDYSIIATLLIISFFVRPTGIITIIGFVVFLLFYHWKILSEKPILKNILLGSIFLLGLIGAWLMFSRWDFTDQLKRGNIVTYMDIAEQTPLYQESMRVEISEIELASEEKHPLVKMIFFVVHNPLHFLKTASLKVGYLLSFYRPYYSTAHNVYAMSWAFFVYILFFIGFRNMTHPIKAFAITMIVVNCVLIGIATVDWDNRFFIPMEPGMVLLAGGGGAYVWRKMNSYFHLQRYW